MYGEKMTWTETTSSGQQVQHTDGGTFTLLDIQGVRALPLFAVPLVLVVLPLFMSSRRASRRASWICGLLLLVIALLGSMSIGLYYLPSALGLLISALATRTR